MGLRTVDCGLLILLCKSLDKKDGVEEIELGEIDRPASSRKTASQNYESEQHTQTNTNASPLYFDSGRAEEILREEVRQTIQDIAWKLLPDICERVVREELQKLLKDSERM